MSDNEEQDPTVDKKSQSRDGYVSRNLGRGSCGRQLAELFLRKGLFGVRFLGGIGAFLTMMSGLFGMLEFYDLSKLLIEAELFLYGFVMLLIELENVICTTAMQRFLEENALFLTRMWGRGLYYLLVASLLIVQLEFVEVVIGIFLVFLGLLHLAVGKYTADLMAGLRKEMGASEVSLDKAQEVFVALDKDHAGTLDASELADLGAQMGLSFASRELDVVMSVLDRDGDGSISFLEFSRWWGGHTYYIV